VKRCIINGVSASIGDNDIGADLSISNWPTYLKFNKAWFENPIHVRSVKEPSNGVVLYWDYPVVPYHLLPKQECSVTLYAVGTQDIPDRITRDTDDYLTRSGSSPLLWLVRSCPNEDVPLLLAQVTGSLEGPRDKLKPGLVANPFYRWNDPRYLDMIRYLLLSRMEDL
jgi:hypothetical protein